MTEQSKVERFDVKASGGLKFKLNEAGTITELSAPEMKFDKWRETHICYTESLGEAHNSLSIETYLTNDELIALVRELRGDAR